MEKLQTKTIALTYEQLNMVYTIIRCAEIRTRKFEKRHFGLDAKVKSVKRQTYPGANSVLELDAEECKLVRMYNTDYCEILAINLEAGGVLSSEIPGIYLLATKIQLLFTSRY